MLMKILKASFCLFGFTTFVACADTKTKNVSLRSIAQIKLPMRTEIPNPQMARLNWVSLNGPWDFDYGDGTDRKVNAVRKSPFTKKINVPFAPETELSGIHDASFNPDNDIVWYRRQVTIPADWGNKVLLHFGAVDYEAEIYVNGRVIGTHRGGYAPFSFDLSGLVLGNEFELMVRAYDPSASTQISRGKQEIIKDEGNIFYDKSTGIREPVWLEKIGESYIEDITFKPQIDGMLEYRVDIARPAPKQKLRVSVFFAGKEVASRLITVSGHTVISALFVPNVSLWSPENPNLYDLKIKLLNGERIVDEVSSYTGFKKLEKRHGAIFLNGKPLVQRLILDQGYYPRSGFTPESAEEMRKDISLAKESGFNGARFHQQTANPHKRYLADRLGYLYWIEVPSARDLRDPASKQNFENEAADIFISVKNAVGFITAVGFNETWGHWQGSRWRLDPDEMARAQIDLARTLYPLLPEGVFYSSNDGWEQISGVDSSGATIPELSDLRKRMITTLHDYPARAFEFNEIYGHLGPSPQAGTPIPRGRGLGPAVFVDGYGFDPEAPVVLSEYGGVTTYFNSEPLPSFLFGYGTIERHRAEALQRIVDQFAELNTTSFFNAGSCYTQLRDTKFEQNGLLNADGSLKYSTESLRAGFKNYRPIVPTAEKEPQPWRYKTTGPVGDWRNLSFNDSAWALSNGGFGTAGTPGAVIRTKWDSEFIWIRRSFKMKNLTQKQLALLHLRINHDESTEVYINGQLAAQLNGYSSGYRYAKISDEAKSAIVPDGENVISIACTQSAGGQAIDAGLYLEVKP